MMQASKSLIICLFCLTVGTEADGENVTNNNNLRLSKDANVSDKSKLRKNAFRRPRFFDESQWSPNLRSRGMAAADVEPIWSEIILYPEEANLGLKAATLSEDAYQEVSDIRGKYDSGSLKVIDTIEGTDGFFGFVALQYCPDWFEQKNCPPNEIYVVFRGTDNLADVNVDLNFDLTPLSDGFSPYIKVSTGFVRSYESVQTRMTAAVESAVNFLGGNFNKILCTGHSLGGALSTLAALQFSHTETDVKKPLFGVNFKPKLYMYNFGSPMVGNQDFSDYYKERGPEEDKTKRFVTINDAVPKMQSWISLGYEHVQTGYLVGGESSNTDVLESHSITGYRKLLDYAAPDDVGDNDVIHSLHLKLEIANVFFAGSSKTIHFDYNPVCSYPRGSSLTGNDYVAGTTYTKAIDHKFFGWEKVRDIPSRIFLIQCCGSDNDQLALKSATLIVNLEEYSTLEWNDPLWIGTRNSVGIDFFSDKQDSLCPKDNIEKIPYTYFYPKGKPKGCCGGYYDDPNLNILNSNDNIPTSISKSNSIEWTASKHDYEPVLDLGSPRVITAVKVSYIVQKTWGKYAPTTMVIKGSTERDVDSSESMFEASRSDGFPSENGGHTVVVTTTDWDAVQYIELSDVIPSSGHSVVSRIVVVGY